MNILFTTGVFPPSIGGPGKITDQLAAALSAKEYECAVLTFGRGDGESRPYDVARLSFKIPQPFRLFATVLKTLWLARNADVIYSLDTYTSGFAAAIASRVLGKPLMQRVSGDSVWESAYNAGKTNDDIAAFQNRSHDLVTRLLIWRRNFILRTARAIVTDSEFLKNFLQTIGVDAAKVTIVRNPVEIHAPAEFDREAFKRERGLKQNTILTMVRLVPWKGVSALIESMPDVLRAHPDTSLIIAGSGPEEKNLQLTAYSLQLQNHVIFTGNISDHQEKQKWYGITDVFALNTFYESMSNVLLEVMAAGKAVVTTRAGGNPELVNDENGMLVRYNNKEQIIAAITKLLDDPTLRQRLGETARQTVQQFTFENFVKKHTDLLLTVIANDRRE